MRISGATLYAVLLLGCFTVHAQEAQNLTSVESAALNRAMLSKFTDPIALDRKTIADFTILGPTETPGKTQEDMKNDVVSELANHDVAMNVFVEDTKGKLSYLTGFISVENKRVIVQRDYMAYKIVKIGSETERMGILLRIEAELTASLKNADLGSLFALGLAAKNSGRGGSLRVRVYGLSGEPITTGIPAPADLTENSIQAAMESVAVIKASIFDPRVKVVPQLLPRL